MTEKQTNGAHVTQVASHYDKLKQFGSAGRLFTTTAGIRNFNNWVKASLIHWSVSHFRNSRNLKNVPVAIMDLASGHGGDLNKWLKANVSHYIGVDNSSGAITKAQDRYGKILERGMQFFDFARWIRADLSSVLSTSKLPSSLHFDFVSCQFAMHYLFSSKSAAHCFFRNVSDRLVPGGYYMCITGNADWIVKAARMAAYSPPMESNGEGHFHSKTENSCVVGYNAGDGEPLWSLTFELPLQFTEYGSMYTMFLRDAVENIPEFIVHQKTLEELASEHDLVLNISMTLHEFFHEYCNAGVYRKMMEDMGALEDGSPHPSAWSLASMYRIYLFEKRAPQRKFVFTHRLRMPPADSNWQVMLDANPKPVQPELSDEEDDDDDICSD
ncbi:hypothetical protein PCE1_001759 [Barthelona sp. PCE]